VFYETSNTRLVYEVCSRRESTVDKERPAMTDASIVLCIGIQKLVDKWDRCSNKLGKYVEKMKR